MNCSIELKSNADCIFINCRTCRKTIAVMDLTALGPRRHPTNAIANWVAAQKGAIEEHRGNAERKAA